MVSEIKTLISLNNNIKDGILIKTDLDQYVQKIISNATILSVMDCGTLEGFIAYYKNDLKKEHAYLTMILVNKRNQSKGIGRLLLNSAIFDLKNNNFKKFQLEVLKKNEKAILFYQKHSFKIIENRHELWLMELNL